jgi:hypothetical protein
VTNDAFDSQTHANQGSEEHLLIREALLLAAEPVRTLTHRRTNPDDGRDEAKSSGIIEDQKGAMPGDLVSSSVISDGEGQSGGQSEAHEVAQGLGSLAASAPVERASDPIAVALASAVAEAAKAGRWDIVAQPAKELEARRP